MAIHFTDEEKKEFLSESSEIYKKRDADDQKEDIKKMSSEKKLQYFKDYYLKGTVIALVVIAYLVFNLIQAFQRKPSDALYIAIAQDVIDDDKAEEFKNAVEDYLKIDKKLERVVVDNGCNQQKLQAYFYAGTADILITSEEDFNNWASAEYLMSSNKNKTVSFYKEYDSKYQYYTKFITGEDVLNNTSTRKTEKGEDQTEYNCGLYLSDSEKYKQITVGIEKPVIGIATTSQHKTEAKKFVKYMMDNSIKMKLEKKTEK